MRRLLLLFAVAACLAIVLPAAGAMPVSAQNFPALTGYVNDDAGLLSPQGKA